MNNQITDLDQISEYPPNPPKWEITELIFQIIGHTRWSRRQLANNLGYDNQGISEQHLNQLLESGDVDSDLARRLPKALDIVPDMVEYSIHVTGEQQAEHEKEVAHWKDQKARMEFSPHLTVQVDIRQKKLPIFALQIIGNALHLDISDDLPNQSEEVQISVVQNMITNYANTEKGRRCRLGFPGPTGFTYYPAHRESWSFSENGKLIKKSTDQIPKPGTV